MGEYLMALGIRFVCADSPNDTPLIISIKIALGEDEAKKISERTSAALKQRILSKGKWQKISAAYLSGEVGKLGTARIIQLARENPHNIRASQMISSKKREGLNLPEIAKFLNENSFLTSRGNRFHASQVKRLYENYC